MATLAASMLLPSKLKPCLLEDKSCLLNSRCFRSPSKKSQSLSPVMRLFGPAIFEASKLKVLFLGVDEEKHPPKLPRTYTLTHSDITSKLTLAVSQSINNSQLQGWYNKLYRDEVVAEWKKVKGTMSLHVHCHISGGHFLLDLIAPLRYYIFCRELPVVLNAFVHGDENLFNNYPELQEAIVWVYFHSSIPEFNKVECWGPLRDAMEPTSENYKKMMMINEQERLAQQQEVDDDEEQASIRSKSSSKWDMLEPCTEPCSCCFPPTSLVPWTPSPSQTEQQHDHNLPGDVSIRSTGMR